MIEDNTMDINGLNYEDAPTLFTILLTISLFFTIVILIIVLAILMILSVWSIVTWPIKKTYGMLYKIFKRSGINDRNPE